MFRERKFVQRVEKVGEDILPDQHINNKQNWSEIKVKRYFYFD
jgi:hypothetical protein